MSHSASQRVHRTLLAAAIVGCALRPEPALGQKYPIEVTDSTIVIYGHQNSVSSVAFSPDGSLLASASYDGQAKVWNIPERRLVRELAAVAVQIAVAFSADGKRIATGDLWDNRVRLWNVGTGELIATVGERRGAVYAVAFSPDGQQIASARSDKTVKIWRVDSTASQRSLVGHTGEVRSIAFSADGRWLASGSGDKTVRLWRGDSLPPVATLPGHSKAVVATAFVPGADVLATGSTDGVVRLWEPSSGRLLRMMSLCVDLNAIAISHDGTMIACSGPADGAVRVYDVASGAVIHKFLGHTGGKTTQTAATAIARAVAFSPSGEWLASGGDDGTVRLWRVDRK